MSDKRSPWREPMVWLIAALPAVAVVGGIVMVIVSSRAGNIDAVRDEVKRTAQIQTTDLGPDEQARALGLSAVLRTTKDGVQVFPASGTFDRTQSLHLLMQHPNRGDGDIVVDLKPDELGWSATLEVDASHDWSLQLGSADGEWRLRGRLPRGQHAAHLGSSLATQ